MLKLASKGELNIPSIHDRVNNYSFLVPSHVIVELEKIGVISVMLYFQRTSECSSKKLEWINQLFALALVPKQDPKPQEHDSLDYLLTAIIHVGFGELTTDLQKTISGQTVKFAVSLLNDLTKKCWDFLWENPEKELHAFEFPNEGLHLQLSAFKNCYLEQLAFLISYKPEIKPITAIKIQHDWTYYKSPKNVVNFIVKVNIIYSNKVLSYFFWNFANIVLCKFCIAFDSLGSGHSYWKNWRNSEQIWNQLENFTPYSINSSSLLSSWK